MNANLELRKKNLILLTWFRVKKIYIYFNSHVNIAYKIRPNSCWFSNSTSNLFCLLLPHLSKFCVILLYTIIIMLFCLLILNGMLMYMALFYIGFFKIIKKKKKSTAIGFCWIWVRLILLFVSFWFFFGLDPVHTLHYFVYSNYLDSSFSSLSFF